MCSGAGVNSRASVAVPDVLRDVVDVLLHREAEPHAPRQHERRQLIAPPHQPRQQRQEAHELRQLLAQSHAQHDYRAARRQLRRCPPGPTAAPARR